jgi:hypothetical protein
MGNCAGIDWASEEHDVLIEDAGGEELLAATFAPTVSQPPPFTIGPHSPNSETLPGCPRPRTSSGSSGC